MTSLAWTDVSLRVRAAQTLRTTSSVLMAWFWFAVVLSTNRKSSSLVK